MSWVYFKTLTLDKTQSTTSNENEIDFYIQSMGFVEDVL